MRIFTAILMAIIATNSFSQKSEDLIPKQAVSVFSVNNVNLLQKISLDDLVKYEFMEEVQQELFDGSTSGKTLKDSGIDFNQKLNIFFGRGAEFELSGFTFGVNDREKLFQVFDDFQAMESNYTDVDFYASYFNRIAIKGNVGILFRVTPTMDLVNQITDSIWYARGNDWPWDWDVTFDELTGDLDENNEYINDNYEEVEEEVEYFEEVEIEENTPLENIDFPVAEEDPTTKTYFELRDSVEISLQYADLKKVCDELFIEGDNLVRYSSDFTQQLTHNSEGTFYFDNSRTMRRSNDLVSLRSLYPNFYRELEELYYGNVMLGDLVINENSIALKLNANYNEKLGSIYQKMTNAKFDNNVLKYIHSDNHAFFTYRINMREAYEQMYEVVHPLLESEAENDMSFSSALLFLELWDDLVNKDALFDTYKGSMFGTYNGIAKVKTKKFIFDYNEETFEYTEQEVDAEEDMPLFTMGFSTANLEIPEKVLKHFARTQESCHREGNVWIFENAILNSAPLYIITKNNLFIVTNDSDLARNHSDGYGQNTMAKQLSKRAKKSGFLYGYADLGKAIEKLPRELFNDDENEMLDVIRGKSGKIEFTSSKTSTNHTSFNLEYQFDGEYEAAGRPDQ